MSRNMEFFHGSNHPFEVGDMLSPEHDTYEGGEVHATNDKMWASSFGDHLYQVEPTGHFEKVNEHEGAEHWVSRTGLRVKKVFY